MDGFSNRELDNVVPLPTNWMLRYYSKDLVCYTRVPVEKVPENVLVYDVGSNTVQTVALNRGPKSLYLLAKSSERCGLGENMVTDDNFPRLSDTAQTHVLDVALPKAREKMRARDVAQRIDTVLVDITEAGRAAYSYDAHPVIRFCKNIAEVIEIPTAAINILSPEGEGRFATKAAKYSRPFAHGVAAMGGGNSVEFTLFDHGTPIAEKTIRMGSNSLSIDSQPLQSINKGLDAVPFMRADSEARHRLDEPTEFIGSGGFFRGYGRMLGLRINQHSPVAAIPCEGHTFVVDERLLAQIQSLGSATVKQLRREFVQFLLRETFDEKKFSKWLKSKEGKAFKETEDWREFEKRIAPRVKSFPLVSQFLTAAFQRCNPARASFIPHGLREGIVESFDISSWRAPISKEPDLPSVQPGIALAPEQADQPVQAELRRALGR